MKITKVLGLAGKFLLLSLLLFVLRMVAQTIVGPKDIPALPMEQMPAVFLGLTLAGLVDTALFVLLAFRSRWTGWRLAPGRGLVFIGVTGVMPQSETL
jgi:hypothetical protein